MAALKLPLGDCVTGCYAQLVILLKTIVAVYQQEFVKQCFCVVVAKHENFSENSLFIVIKIPL